MAKRFFSSLIFAAIAAIIVYLLSGVFYNYAYSPYYLIALFLFMFIAWFVAFPLFFTKRRVKDKKL